MAPIVKESKLQKKVNVFRCPNSFRVKSPNPDEIDVMAVTIKAKYGNILASGPVLLQNFDELCY